MIQKIKYLKRKNLHNFIHIGDDRFLVGLKKRLESPVEIDSLLMP